MDEWQVTKMWIWRIVGIVIILTLGIGAINFICTPAKVITKVFNPDKIIQNYEFYQETYSQIKSTKVKINNALTSLEGLEGDIKERRQIELFGLNNYLQDLIAQYNANSRMLTRKFFKSHDLPYQIEYGGSFKEKINYKL